MAGITINNVLPEIIEEMDLEEAFGALRGESPRSLFFDPTDVAAAIAFLCTEAARGITYSDIRIPGNIFKRPGDIPPVVSDC